MRLTNLNTEDLLTYRTQLFRELKIIIASINAIEKLLILNDVPVTKNKDIMAAEIGRRGGLRGGRERAKRMTPEQRSESARKAANARWENKKEASDANKEGD